MGSLAFLSRPHIPHLIRASVGAGLVIAATALSLSYESEWVLSRYPFLPYWLCVLVSAWLAGVAGGLASTATAGLAIAYFVLPPHGSLAVRNRVDDVALAAFVATGMIVSALAGELRHARGKAEAHARESSAAAAQLATERALLRAVVDQLPIGVSITEIPSGRMIHNAEAVRLLRHPLPNPVLQQFPREYGAVHPEGRVYAPSEYPTSRSLATGEVIRDEELLYRRGDGTATYLSVTSAPIRDIQGRIVAIVAAFHDISDQKHAAVEREHLLAREHDARMQAEAANRLKDDFMAMLSHELRTPLNVIVGRTHSLVRRRDAPADVLRAIGIVDRNARALMRLVEDMLDVQRITSGKLRMEPKDIALAPIVLSVIESQRTIAEQRQVLLETDVSDVWVYGDPARLQQVFWNIVANAVKFTPAGGRVSVTLRRAGDDALLTVRDTGEGIDPVFLPHVFDRFRQADASTARRHGGLGLGLNIALTIVEMHGGRIIARSAGRGQGSTFEVRLPVRRSAA